MKWEYMCVRTDGPFLNELETVLEEGFEPFFVTVEGNGKRYVHVRRQS